MDTNVFRYVLEVDKCKNITLAAKHLFISQPALTKQLSKLEKELGFQLFDRAHTPITTTPQGELFLDFARRYQELEQDFQNDIALSPGGPGPHCHHPPGRRIRRHPHRRLYGRLPQHLPGISGHERP